MSFHKRSETHSDDGSPSSLSHCSSSASDRDEKPVLPFPSMQRLSRSRSGACGAGGDGVSPGWIMANGERGGSRGSAECGGASSYSRGALPLANDQASTSGTISTRTQPTFVLKLFAMVRDYPDPPEQPLICWSRGGEMFAVYNHVDFSKIVLPEYFKHNNWQSFVRQLNMYGFHKVNDVLSSSAAHAAQAWEFQHPQFRRGRPDLLQFIKRKTTRNNAASTCAGTVAGLLPPPQPALPAHLPPLLASPVPSPVYTTAHVLHPSLPPHPPAWAASTSLASCSPGSTGRTMPDYSAVSPAPGSSSGYHSPSRRSHIAGWLSTEGGASLRPAGHGLPPYSASHNSAPLAPQPGSLVSLVPPRPPAHPPTKSSPPTQAQLDAVRVELERHTEAMYRQSQDDIADKHRIAVIFRSMLDIIRGLAEGRYGPSPVLQEQNKEGRLKLLEDFEAAESAVAQLGPTPEGTLRAVATPVTSVGLANSSGCPMGGEGTSREPLHQVGRTGSAPEWWAGASLSSGVAPRLSVGSRAPDHTEWSPSSGSAPPMSRGKSNAEFAPAALNGDVGGGKVQLPSIRSMLPHDGEEPTLGSRFAAPNGAGRRMDEDDEREAPKRVRYR